MLHLEQLAPHIASLGHYLADRRRRWHSEAETARQWLAEAPPADEALRTRLRLLAGRFPSIPLAAPALDAPLNARIAVPPPPVPPRGTAIIGVDGSQIYPDRHAPILYYLLQVGALYFRYDESTPRPFRRATLHFEDHELYEAPGQLVSANRIAMRRTVAEMRYAAELVQLAAEEGTPPPIFVLGDGPLLWVGNRRGGDEEARARRSYLEALSRIRDAGGAPVGFVERPGGRYFVTLLWAARLDDDETLSEKFERHPLHRLSDEMLMRVWLPPGARTLWLERLSEANDAHAQAGHRIWFCYLNVGEAGHPVIARVEVPAWVARHPTWPAHLHVTLHHQAAVLRGHPYVLARAHEEALVTARDKAALEQLIQRHLLALGIPALPSEKAAQKRLL